MPVYGVNWAKAFNAGAMRKWVQIFVLTYLYNESNICL